MNGSLTEPIPGNQGAQQRCGIHSLFLIFRLSYWQNFSQAWGIKQTDNTSNSECALQIAQGYRNCQRL